MKQLIPFAGNIGSDPELKQHEGDAVLSFSLRQPRFKNTGTAEEPNFEDVHGYWADCSLWGKPAEAAFRVLQKGAAVTGLAELGVRRVAKKDAEDTLLTFINYRIVSIGVMPRCIETLTYRARQAPDAGAGEAPDAPVADPEAPASGEAVQQKQQKKVNEP